MLTDGVLDGEVVVVTERVTELLEEIEFEVILGEAVYPTQP